VDLTATQAQTKEAPPTTSREGGEAQRPAFTRASQNMATAVTLLDMLPAPSTNTVDMLHLCPYIPVFPSS
jgi:hypothetical protein